MLLKRYKKVVVLILVCFLCVVYSKTIGAMSVEVAPHRFVFSIDKANTQEAEVTNISDHQVKLKIYCEPAPNQAKEQYLGEWVVIFPKLLTLNPGEKKTVRFSVRPPQGLKDGEYRAFLFFEEMYEKKDKPKTTQEAQIDFQLLTKLGVNIYGQCGQIVHQGELRNTKVEYQNGKLDFKGVFINQGNAHILASVTVQIFNEKQQIVKTENITSFAVHRGTSENFQYTTTDIKDNGKYTLKLTFTQDKKVLNSYSTSFEISNGKLKD